MNLCPTLLNLPQLPGMVRHIFQIHWLTPPLHPGILNVIPVAMLGMGMDPWGVSILLPVGLLAGLSVLLPHSWFWLDVGGGGVTASPFFPHRQERSVLHQIQMDPDKEPHFSLRRCGSV